MLRWGLQEGRSVIPKSTKPARIAEIGLLAYMI
jgi:diketogulonate reductase-like aldo/keto reductase